MDLSTGIVSQTLEAEEPEEECIYIFDYLMLAVINLGMQYIRYLDSYAISRTLHRQWQKVQMKNPSEFITVMRLIGMNLS